MSHLSPIAADDQFVDHLEDDTSMLLGWTDDEGRFFCHDDHGRVVELKDGDPWPQHIAVDLIGAEPARQTESPNEVANQRIALAIYVFAGLSALMFIGQFVRAYLAGRL